MKTSIIIVLLAIGYSTPGYGQGGGIENYKALERQQSQRHFFDSLKRLSQLKNNIMNTRDERNDMPVANQKLEGKYIGNNGKGSDVYAMMPYNMPCLVPDSSYSSNMPVKKMSIKTLPVVEFRKNNYNNSPID